MPGWKTETVGRLDHDALPAAARDYVRMIEEEVGARVDLISTGPRREETIVRPGGQLEEWLGDGFGAVLDNRG